MAALGPYGQIPDSTFFMIGIAFVISMITNLANRFLVDVKKMKEISVEVKSWQDEFNKARKSGDKQLLAKVNKKQPAIMKLQSKMMMDRMKVTLITIIPFLLFWNVLGKFYGMVAGGGFAAISPFRFPWLLEGPSVVPTLSVPIKVSWFTWYLICSLAIQLPTARLLGTYPEQE